MQWDRIARTAARAAVGSAAVAGAASLGAATYFARRVLTPEGEGPTDHVIHDLDDETVTLTRTLESEVMGRYGLWNEDRSAHLRMGEVRAMTDTTVTREVLGIDYGDPQPGPARFNSHYYAQPPDLALGLPTEAVTIDAEIGELPAWLVPAAEPGDRWAILVHGRGAFRFECVRGVRPLHDAGLTVLVPAYRNDRDAPSGPDGRYTLGLSEWRDIGTRSGMRCAPEPAPSPWADGPWVGRSACSSSRSRTWRASSPVSSSTARSSTGVTSCATTPR